LFLRFIHILIEPILYGKIFVHNGIDDHISKVVGSQDAHLTLALIQDRNVGLILQHFADMDQ
jgi:hypothetical protein